jgi:hypothetical protein
MAVAVAVATKLKASDKLPRGEYLVVRMGDQFLASHKLVEQVRFINGPWRWGVKQDPPKRVVVGHTKQTRFVSTVEEAKQFRRLKQANAACEILNRQYSELSKATVERHGGK